VTPKKRRVLRITLGIAVAVITLTPLGFAVLQPVKVLPRISLAPGFQLTDASGQRLTSDDLKGSIVLYTFTYSACGDRCAEQTRFMRETQERLAEVESGGMPVRLVTVSFDPERDSPSALRDAAAKAGADPRVWSFATGESTSLKALIGGGFNVYYEPGEEGDFSFETVYVLVDPLGIKRVVYRYQTPAHESVIRDVEGLAREARAEGMAHLAYEAAHLFSCYSTPY
jgi:protein SCO1/2